MAFALLAKRTAAWIVDSLLGVILPFLVVDFAVFKPFLVNMALKHSLEWPIDPQSLWFALVPSEKGLVLAFFGLTAWVIPSIYFASFEASGWSATPGKRAVGLVVTGNEGEPISWWRAWARFWSKVLCGVIWPLTVGSVNGIVASQRHQALHDMMTRCFVHARARAEQPVPVS
jgi:uncharacterized RDD family membrane protein YckC